MLVSSTRTFIPTVYSTRSIYGVSRIGCREVVGHGTNGMNNYKDDAHFPFPAIRFQEFNSYLLSLKQKEKGNWKCLTCEEKKMLYRASFCQTFAEFQADTGTWKFIIGCVLFGLSFPCWAQMFAHFYVHEPFPESLKYENQKAQLRRMLEIRANPIDGISSLWEYKQDTWKWLATEMEIK